jgi:ribosomal protein S18 acetylase RimI-like enzyme
MITLFHRAYADAADLQAIINLLRITRPADLITEYPSITDLQEMLAMLEWQAHTRLWETRDGQLLGFASVDVTQGWLMFEVIPEVTIYHEIEAQVIAWAMGQIAKANQENIQPITLKTGCYDYNAKRIALLERYGFVAQPVRTLHFQRSLHEPISAPQLPDGFIIRHVTGEEEVEACVALHQAAFGTQNMTVEYRLAMMRVPEYDPKLDLIAIAPDGRLASFCVCHISQEENTLTGRNEGYTDPVGTHPAFQRQGLAQALLLTGFHLLKQQGIDNAILSTWGENIPMQRTAASVGFCLQSTTIFFEKDL